MDKERESYDFILECPFVLSSCPIPLDIRDSVNYIQVVFIIRLHCTVILKKFITRVIFSKVTQ